MPVARHTFRHAPDRSSARRASSYIRAEIRSRRTSMRIGRRRCASWMRPIQNPSCAPTRSSPPRASKVLISGSPASAGPASMQNIFGRKVRRGNARPFSSFTAIPVTAAIGSTSSAGPAGGSSALRRWDCRGQGGRSEDSGQVKGTTQARAHRARPRRFPMRANWRSAKSSSIRRNSRVSS